MICKNRPENELEKRVRLDKEEDESLNKVKAVEKRRKQYEELKKEFEKGSNG